MDGSITQPPKPNTIRHRVDPRCAPIEKAARLMGMTKTDFELALPQLQARGFPRPVPVINLWDLTAINRWLDDQIDSETRSAKNAADVVAQRLEKMRNGA